MDEWTLNDLLECSVCLDRLDTSSKVLPCQHTFCKKCLEEIVLTHKELRCPECRILVDSKIDELPPNVLLMRILEGMRNAGNPIPKKKIPVLQRHLGNQPPLLASPQVPPSQSSHNIGENNRPHTAPKQNAITNQPFARAVYDYISKETGDLSFKKGDIIVLHRKIDTQWCQGECGGKTGVFPLSYVQIMTPLPNQIATCKALYDFRMTNDEEEGCLTFHKDEIITVIRRVDENWAEGKLNDRIGIFPLAFVEMNSVARALMKLSTNSQPGPSRVAPPTPTAEESTPLIPTDHSRTVSNCVNVHTASQNNITNMPPSQSAQPNQTQRISSPLPVTTAVTGSGTDSSSTVSSSSTTPNSSSSTSSSSSTAPSSPASNQPVQHPNPFLPPPQTPRQMILQTSHITSTNTTHSVLPTSHITAQQSPLPPRSIAAGAHLHRSPPQVAQVDPSTAAFQQQQQQREKRHSFSVLTPSHHNCSNSNRHSAEILSSEPAGEVQNSQLTRHGSQRHRRSGSDLPSVTNLPASYVALYPYKPQKADELELRKGGLYLVTERCQDGWFKGTSNRTQKCGVFPGNYVTLAKPINIQGSQSRVASSSPRDAVTPSPDHKSSHHAKTPRSSQNGRQAQVMLAPPELPPRAASPSSRHPKSAQAISTSWHGPQNESPSVQKCSADAMAASAPPPTSAVKNDSRHMTMSTAVSPPPNVSVVSTPSKSTEKTKEKKEKSSLMRRLASMKRSKSPPASASYSMDNPVFDDTPVTALHSPAHPQAVHSRSGSCPSQLIQLMPDGSTHRLFSASVSARLKHKERPSVSNANFAHIASRQMENGAVATSTGSSSHRKSNSLDAGDARKPRPLVPPVRERFRCIVPYPPNSEYELELRVGDIIYVHKKREDGWYKGTQQRTGRTGLFPASFVETY